MSESNKLLHQHGISTQRPNDNISDERKETYRDLHENHLDADEDRNRITAEKVLKILFKYYRPHSVLDVGCGLGIWLSLARALGVEEIHGIEGPWLDINLLRIEPEHISISDLEHTFNLGRRFDLVISLEVAEHLSKKAAESFVQSLTHHSDVILFSAAIPHQGGHHHINEQWPPYWTDLFARFDFVCLDFIRGHIWDNEDVYWHIRQNVLLFVSKKLSKDSNYKNLFEYESDNRPLSVVHPDAYSGLFRLLSQLQQIQQKYDTLLNYFSECGTCMVSVCGGEIRISKMCPTENIS